MPRFQYKARNKKNDPIEGIIDADSQSGAADLLLERELIVTSLEEIKAAAGLFFLKSLFNKVSKKDLAIFLRQLAILISAAIPLVQALRILAEQANKSVLREALLDIVQEVEGGTKLSVAFARFPTIFSNFFVNMVRSGETSGKLDEILNYLADQQERDYELQSKLIGALSYPIFIICVMFLAGFVMMVFVLPKMLTMFTELGPDVKLPMTTQILINVTGFVSKFWYVVVAAVVGGAVGLRIYAKTAKGRKMLDYMKMRIPIIGMLLRYIAVIRFTRSFSTILVGGVTVPAGLRIVRDVVGNAVFEDLLAQTIREVEDGNPVSATFMKSKDMPKMVAQMMAVGEQTGRLDDVLEKITQFYVREVNATIETVISLIEPAIMVLLGVGVAIIVSGILLPMYTITAQV